MGTLPDPEGASGGGSPPPMSTAATASADQAAEDRTLGGFYRPFVDSAVAPHRLFVASRGTALGPLAPWAHRTAHGHWLPCGVAEYLRRGWSQPERRG